MLIQNLILSILSSAGVSAALTATLVWLSREWISTRLRASIQHEYAEKLETFKAQLKAEHEIAVITLRADLERDAAIRATAHGASTEGQKAAMERKLAAIDRLWKRVLHIRTNLPPLITLIDAITVADYARDKDHPFFRKLAGDGTPEQLSVLFDDRSDRTEQSRPYVGEYAWAIFYCYEAIMIRLLVVLHIGRDDAAKVEWYKDSGTRALIAGALTRSELAEFDQLQFGRLAWLQRTLERKLLNAAQKVISGEEFGVESLEQASIIQQRATALRSATTRAQAES
jgi:hypothetical protein